MTIAGDDGKAVNGYLSAAASRDMRNRLAEQLMKTSDDICIIEMGRLTGDEAFANTLLSTATSGLSIASAAVKASPLNSILAAFASFTNSTRDHIRAEIYRNFVSYELIKAIGAARTIKLQAIRSHYGDAVAYTTPAPSGASVTPYYVDTMIHDVNDYHHLCSLSEGFTLVDAAVSKAGPDASSQRDALTIAINDLGTRINELNSQIQDPKTPAAAKTGLTTQRDALLTQQTNLYTSRASLTAVSQQAPAAAPK